MTIANKQLQTVRAQLFQLGGRYIREAYKIQITLIDRDHFNLSVDQFNLPNGGTVKFLQQIETNGVSIEIISYSYEYRRADRFYIRYDKDPANFEEGVHPLNHLHLNANAPRYVSGEVSLMQFFKFVITQLE